MNNETKRTGWRSAMRLCAASLALAATGSAMADITWTGAGGDSNWETTSNWNGYDTTTGMVLDHSTVSDAYEIDISSNPERAAYIWVAAANGVTLKASGTYGLNQTGGDIRVGTWANGTLTIDGGTHIINSLVVASGWWSNFAPTGVMTIKGGATVTAGWNALGDTDSDTTTSLHNPTSSGTLNVENASLAFTSDMLVGRLAVGTLNVNDGGVVSCQGADNSARWTSLGEAASGNGTINLNAGGTLAVWHIQKGSGLAAINFNGGTLKTLGNTGNCEYILGNDGAPATGPAVSIGEKGAVFDSNGLDTKVGVAVTGVGTITKKGTGTLTFSGDMSGFIGKVAVANGAGDVILPATASRARPGDYTAKTENQDGTFTFSYDSSSAPAATQYAELYRLDFQDDSTTGWSFSQYAGETANFSIKTRTLVQKDDNDEFLVSKGLMVKTEGNANGNRGVKGTYTIPDEVKRADNYVFEFDWFATENTKKTSDNTSLDLGLYVYASDNSEVVRLISNPVVKANKVQVFLNGASVAESEELDAAPANNYRTDNNDIDCDGTHNQDKWYHVMLTANETAGLTLKILKNDLTTVAFPETRVCDFVNLGKLVLDIYRARSSFQISGGIDDLIATTPAVAGVDGVNYATFASAVAAATSTSKITLYSDVELTASVELPYGATLDLNGYALYTTDTDVDVTFNDGIHYLASTTAGGYKTFSNVVAVFDTVYVWVGENGGAWATSTNWQLAGVTTHGTLPAYNSIVLIPGGDGTEMVIKCPDNYAANAYTGYLSIERDVRLQPSNNRRANQGIHLTKVSGTGTLILEGWTTENNGYYYLNIYAGDSSISKMEVDCDLCVKGYVYFPNSGSGNNKWSRALQLNGSLSGDGSIAFNTQANQPGFLFYGDTTKFEGSYSGGGRNDWNRDGTRFVGASSIGSELAYWKFGVEQNSSSADIGWPLNKAGEYEFGRLDAPYFRAHASGITVKVGNLAGTSTINGKLEYSANKIVKVGDSSTLNLTLTESVGTVEVEAGTLNLLGTVAPTALTMTGEGAIATVVEGNSAVPTLASTLSGTHDIKTTPGDGITTYKVVPLVEPGEAAATTYETAEAATTAAADVVVAVPTAVAAELTTTEQQAAYKDMFEAKAVETSTGSGVWQVTVDFTAAAEAEIKAAEDAISVVDGATPKVTVTAKPGLYYFVKAGTAADSLAVDGTGTLATGDSVTLDMPLPDSGVKYYKVVASPTETL